MRRFGLHRRGLKKRGLAKMGLVHFWLAQMEFRNSGACQDRAFGKMGHACNGFGVAGVPQQHNLTPWQVLLAGFLQDIPPARQPVLQLCSSHRQAIVALHGPSQAGNDWHCMHLHSAGGLVKSCCLGARKWCFCANEAGNAYVMMQYNFIPSAPTVGTGMSILQPVNVEDLVFTLRKHLCV